MDTQQVMQQVNPLLPFIDGITVSGGECTQHSEFITQLFHQIRDLGKTAFVDTNGQRDFTTMPQLVDAMDYAMLDVKAAEPGQHQMLTGQSNQVVLKNLAYLLSVNKLYEVRTVVVPEVLDNHHTVDVVSRMIAPFPWVSYKLLRFRNHGVRGLLASHPSPDMALMQELEALAKANGVQHVKMI